MLLLTSVPFWVKNKGKLFIIGGGERSLDMVQRMVQESGLDKGGYAVVLPMSSGEPDSAVFYTKIQFTALGIQNVYGVFCTKAQANDPAKADSMAGAKLIYISKGRSKPFYGCCGRFEVKKPFSSLQKRRDGGRHQRQRSGDERHHDHWKFQEKPRVFGYVQYH
ncbi:MAG: hypothetical protein IPL27_16025 [Lewinellaceae bacterium]|nr:hypothetical protein [Lewinellaceae bacterium]